MMKVGHSGITRFNPLMKMAQEPSVSTMKLTITADQLVGAAQDLGQEEFTRAVPDARVRPRESGRGRCRPRQHHPVRGDL